MKKLQLLLIALLLNVTIIIAQINLAKSKPISKGGFQGYSANLGYAVDDNVTTYMGGAGASGSFVVIDLGVVCSIDNIKISYSLAPQTQIITTSLDDLVYTSLSTTPSIANTTNTIVLTKYPLNINQHRYVKIIFESTTGSINVNVFEIQIIGSAGTNTITYGYDARGSRTSRNITLLKSASLANSESLLDTTTQALKEDILPSPDNTFFDAVGESKVTIYPNPTRGELVVKVTNPSEEATHRIMLFDSNGALIYQKENATEYTDVDITNQPSGLYILKIFNGGNSTTWKVIKQ